MNQAEISRNFTIRTNLLNSELQIKLQKLETKKQQKSETSLKTQTQLLTEKSTKPNTSSVRSSLKDTFYYSKLRLEQRIKDTARVNRFYDLIDTYYTELTHLQCAKEAIITREEEEKINDVFPLLKTYPDLILDLATIFPDPPSEIKTAIDNQSLWKPNIDQVQTAFNYDPITRSVHDAKYRYLVNMQGNILRSYLDDRKSVDFNTSINCELFLQLSNQSRWNNLWVQLAISLFYSDTLSEAKALQNLHLSFRTTRRLGTELITFQTIAYILRKFKTLPFSIRQDGKYDVSHLSQDWGTSIIPLLYSLAELSKEERGCNVNAEFLAPIITYRVKCAYTSFETETLNRKGIYSSMIKILTSTITKYARYNFDQSGTVQRILLFDGNKEVFTTDTELQDLQDKVKEKCDPSFLKVFNKYANQLNKGSHTQNTELMRWLSGVLLTMGNTGLYYKTSLMLEKEKAVASQTLGTLDFPKPEKMMILNDIKIDVKTDWKSGDEIYSEIAKRYKTLISKHLHTLNGNMQEWFYTLLTNRSQGFKVDVEKFVHTMGIDPELLPDLKNVGQVRVASFLLSNQTFAIFSDFFDELQRSGMCTIRDSNNRKSRIVEILPNVDQTAYAIVLKIFEEFKAESDDIAVGKQIGGILDMSLQCRTTGNPAGICIFSDVAGMDAHTQPHIAVMYLKLLAEEIIDQKIGPINYFPFKSSNCLVQQVYDHRNIRITGSHVTPIPEGYVLEHIPALAQALLLIASQRLNKKYVLKDNIFKVNIDITPTIFESGRFDTSAQHSTSLKICANIVYDSLPYQVPGVVGKYKAEQLKFGDDSIETIIDIALSPTEKKELLSYVLRKSDEVLYRIGLRADSEMSAYYGDFLQQTAMCGVVQPKSSRSTIYTDERNSLVNRDVIDQITNLANIISASAQRVYAPENVMSLVRNIWATNRNYRILSSKNVVVAPDLAPYIKTYSGKSYLQYPLIMISLPPLNFPNQTFKFDNGLVMPASSSIRTVGDCKLNYIWNEVISINSRNKLMEVDVGLIGDAKVVDPVEVFRTALKGTHIFESLLFFSYNRSQELSKTRFEKLSDPITKMGNIAKNYFESQKLFVSSAAAMRLKTTYDITMPDSLLYYMKPIEQLKDMFHTRAETEDEAMGLNDAYLGHLNKIFRIAPKRILDSIVSTCVFWKLSGENTEAVNVEFSQLPLLPGYNVDSDYHRAQVIVGNAFKNTQRINKSLVSFTNRYGGSYNMEAIHRIGSKAKAASGKGDNAFQLFLDAMQLPPKIRSAVEQMFENESTILLPDLYSSGFQPEQYFSISDSTINVRYHYLTLQTRFSQSGRDTLAVVLRDYLFMTANKSPPTKKYVPQLPPATLVRYNLRSLFSQAGVKVL